MARTVHPAFHCFPNFRLDTDNGLITFPRLDAVVQAAAVFAIGLIPAGQRIAHIRLQPIHSPMAAEAVGEGIFGVQLRRYVAAQRYRGNACLCPLLVNQFQHIRLVFVMTLVRGQRQCRRCLAPGWIFHRIFQRRVRSIVFVSKGVLQPQHVLYKEIHSGTALGIYGHPSWRAENGAATRARPGKFRLSELNSRP